MREERARGQALLAQVGAEHMLQPGTLGEWTFKDLVAHLNGWWFYELAGLEALLTGETLHHPWPADWPVDRQNRWIYEANKDRPLADVLADSRAFFEWLERLLTRLPEPVLRESAAIPWLQGRPVGMGFLDGCLEHLYGEHWPELSAWMGRLETGH